MPKIICKPADLRLADTIKLMDGAFGTAIVTKIEDGQVHIYRPYAVTADFSYTGGVIPYIGIETLTLLVTSTAEYEVLNRKELDRKEEVRKEPRD